MWMRGRICVKSPLPSLVTMTVDPVSAIIRLAPVMPTSASWNLRRSTWRASVIRVLASSMGRPGGSSGWAARKVPAMSSLDRWMAGAMMWLGGS